MIGLSKNHTLKGGTSLYSLCMAVPPGGSVSNLKVQSCNLQSLRCQYKGGKRNTIAGLTASSTVTQLQEKIWLLTDVAPHAQRSKSQISLERKIKIFIN